MRHRATWATTLALCLLALGALSALAAAPTIAKVTVSKASTDLVILLAEINPQGQKGSFRFEYGPSDCEKSTCTQIPAPEGELKANSSPETVEAHVEGLTPGTTYHLRVVATNTDGTKESPDRVFATYGLALEGLPDERAYEQASPVKKNAADARGMVAWAKASAAGDRVSFLSTSGIPGGVGEQELPAYLASRGASDWSTQGLLPPATLGTEAFVRGWLPDFSTVFDFANDFGASADGTLVARSSADGSLKEIVGKGEGLNRNPAYVGASADGSKVIFEASAKLPCCKAAVQGASNVYLWDRESDQISLISVLNEKQSPPAGSFAGPYNWMQSATLPLSANSGGSAASYYTQDQHAVSDDGSAYFTAAGSGQLYQRLNPTAAQSPLDGEDKCTEPTLACTLNLSASHRTPPDPLGSRPAAFMAASTDGQRAFFASPEELTDNANTGPPQLPPSIGNADVSVEPRVIEAEIPLISAGGIAVDSKYIYWVNTADKTIGRVELNGANPKAKFIEVPSLKVENSKGEEEDVPANPQYVAVDAGHIYWTNEGEGENKEGTIGRADIEGSAASIEVKWIEGASQPKGIAVDSKYLYWANAGKDQPVRTIGRAEIGGGDVKLAFIATSNTEFPQGVAVDASHIYWTVNEPNGSSSNSYLLRTDLDGSNKKQKFIEAKVEPRGIAVDAGHVYWASQGEESIGRANLDLEERQLDFIEVEGKPKGLAVAAGHLHWSLNGESPPNPGNDLYRYQAAGEELSDLTVDEKDTNGAEVKGVLGASLDGTRVYLAANGDLDEGGPATAGNCKGSITAGLNFSGQCSLYLLEEAAPGAWNTSLIARLDANGDGKESDAMNWLGRGSAEGPFVSEGQSEKTAHASADGSTLLFRSQRQLSPYDNEGIPELYRFEVGEGVSCISCNPTGEEPVGAARLGSIGLSTLPPQLDPANLLSRNLSADGKRAFFETSDPLVIEDTNGNGKAGCPLEGAPAFRFPTCQDVYEWEAQGTGSCKEDVQGGGCLYLLSTGTSPNASFFADASLSGDSAFIATRSAGLVRQDQDQLQDIYDTRTGGGLESQNEPPPIECESIDGCHGPQSTPPASQSPASTSLGGAGNKKQARQPGKKHKHKKRHHKRKRAAAKAGGKNR